MTDRVNIKPMPAAIRKLPEKWRPRPEPIWNFHEEPTADDYALAQRLFAKLDPESQRWYRGLFE